MLEHRETERKGLERGFLSLLLGSLICRVVHW